MMINKIFLVFFWICIYFMQKILIDKKWKLNPITTGFKMYLLSIIISLIYDSSESYTGLYIILIFFIFCFLGFLVIVRGKTKSKQLKKENEYYKQYNPVILRKLIILLLFIIIPISIVYLVQKGVSFSNLFDLDEILAINEISAINRYTGNSTSSIFNIFNQIKINLIYICALLSGVYFYIEEKNYKLSYVVFFISIIELLFSNGKLGLILTCVLFIIGIIMGMLYQRDKLDLSKSKYKVLFIFLIFVMIVLYISMLFRVGDFSIKTQTEIQGKFVNYAFGSYYAFNDWFINNVHDLKILGFGVNTFMGIFNLLGLVTREQGVYKIMYTNSPWNTNVYTAFRGILEDYGLIGFLFFAFMFGVVTGIVYKKYINRKKLRHMCLLGMCYLFVFFSVLGSPFVYSSLSFVLLVTILFIKWGGIVKWRKIKVKLK